MASDVIVTHASLGQRKGFLGKWFTRPEFNSSTRRGIISFVVALVLWELGSKSGAWFGVDVPVIGAVPAPDTVIAAWIKLIGDPGYWQSWLQSVIRVAIGFSAATIVAVPFGLALSSNPNVRSFAFPVFELLRPIPPLAWVPASIIFWPTQELSIDFVIFLGGFYTIVLNVLGGADSIDPRLIQAARSMGASPWNIFRRIVLPAVLPSIGVGMEVGIGITWEVVVAAEMISGGGGASSSGGGLGFLIWNSYIGGAYPNIIVGMISIGIAGYLSSALVRLCVHRLTPWLKRS